MQVAGVNRRLKKRTNVTIVGRASSIDGIQILVGAEVDLAIVHGWHRHERSFGSTLRARDPNTVSRSMTNTHAASETQISSWPTDEYRVATAFRLSCSNCQQQIWIHFEVAVDRRYSAGIGFFSLLEAWINCFASSCRISRVNLRFQLRSCSSPSC